MAAKKKVTKKKATKKTSHADKLRAAKKKAANSGLMKYKDEMPKVSTKKKKK